MKTTPSQKKTSWNLKLFNKIQLSCKCKITVYENWKYFFSFYVQSINIEIFYNPLRIKKIQSKKKAIWSSNRHHSKLKQTDDTRRLNKQIEEKNWRQTTLETTNKNKQKAFPWPSQFSHFSFRLQNIYNSGCPGWERMATSKILFPNNEGWQNLI